MASMRTTTMTTIMSTNMHITIITRTIPISAPLTCTCWPTP